MSSELSNVQSLRAVDAWIDVINANINGGVRTAYKTSRLKFAGSNAEVVRGGTTSTLPLEFPEPSLVTANTVIDFGQGAITTSTENTHLAIQGPGFFVVANPGSLNTTTGALNVTTATKLYLTRDGEFHANAKGFLVTNAGYVLVTVRVNTPTFISTNMRAVYDDMDGNPVGTGMTSAVKLSDFIVNNLGVNTKCADGTTNLGFTTGALVDFDNRQNLRYSAFGSSVFQLDYDGATAGFDPNLTARQVTSSQATILGKSLEASNASMTQSVPELSLAQKLFSALTKVLQTKQTNVDGVINLIR